MNKEVNSTIGIGAGIVLLLLVIGMGIYFLNRPEPLNPHGIAAGAKSGAANPQTGGGRKAFGQAQGANASF